MLRFGNTTRKLACVNGEKICRLAHHLAAEVLPNHPTGTNQKRKKGLASRYPAKSETYSWPCVSLAMFVLTRDLRPLPDGSSQVLLMDATE